MSLPSYVLLICSIADTDEDYDKLAEAMKDIDASWQEEERSFACAQDDIYFIQCVKDSSAAMDIAKAWEAEKEAVLLEGSAGRISAVSVMAYPPGRPILVPGEVITDKVLGEIRSLLNAKCVVKGLKTVI